MTTVWLATAGEYDDFRVLHVFARREDAESYPLADSVHGFELERGAVKVAPWHEIRWTPALRDREADGLAQANPHYNWECRDLRGGWNGAPSWSVDNFDRDVLTVSGWDQTQVRQVYREQRARYEAAHP